MDSFNNLNNFNNFNNSNNLNNFNAPQPPYPYNGGYVAPAPACPRPQYSPYPQYPPVREQTPEEKRAAQIRHEKRLVRKLGNRSGWSVFVVDILMNLLAIAISLSFMAADEASFLELENAMVSMVGMFAGGTFLILITNTKMRNAVTFKPVRSFKRCIAALSIGLAAIPLCNLFSQIVSDSLSMIGISQKSYGIIGADNVEITPLYIAVEVLCTAIIPAISEEYMFRGAILGSLKPYGEGFAIVMSSLLFGLLHGNFEQIPFAFLGGLFFGYIRVYTGSLIFPMILHFSNNLLAVVMDILENTCGGFIPGTKITVPDIVVLIYYTVFLTLAVIAFVKLSRRDKDFLRLNRPQSLISEKQKAVSFIASPGFIVFAALMALMTAFQYIVS